ncbi:unnamed protein product, partial [Symbiodinium sp. CCMP2592]
MHGQWNLHDEAALAAALLKPKRKPMSSEPLALWNGTTSSSLAPAPRATHTESSPQDTKPNDAKADASSSSSASTPPNKDLDKMDCRVVGGNQETVMMDEAVVEVKTKPNDPRDEQEETEDEQEETAAEQQEQDMPQDEQQEQVMPEYAPWIPLADKCGSFALHSLNRNVWLLCARRCFEKDLAAALDGDHTGNISIEELLSFIERGSATFFRDTSSTKETSQMEDSSVRDQEVPKSRDSTHSDDDDDTDASEKKAPAAAPRPSKSVLASTREPYNRFVYRPLTPPQGGSLITMSPLSSREHRARKASLVSRPKEPQRRGEPRKKDAEPEKASESKGAAKTATPVALHTG